MSFEVLGIDLGSYSLKTNKEILCRSVYKIREAKNSLDLSVQDVITYNGVQYHIGTGSFDTEITKAEKKDTLPLFLYGIAKSVNSRVCKVKVVTGLPKYQLDNKKNTETIKNRFKGRFCFHLDSVAYDIDVLDVAIFPEGVGAFYSIPTLQKDKDYILIDIGGSTFNVALFQSGVLIKVETLPFGSINLLHDICSHAMSLHNRKYTLDDMERYRQRGVIGKTGDKMDYAYNLAEPYIEELFALLNLQFPYKDCYILVSGGGVEMFAANLAARIKDISMVKHYLFANAKGFAIVGGMFFGQNN